MTENIKNRYKIFFIYSFFLICFCFGLGTVVEKGEVSQQENRLLVSFPEISILLEKDGASRFTNQVDEFFTDRFLYREQILNLNSRLTANLFVEANSDNFVVGEEGWLFVNGGDKQSFRNQALDNFRQLDTISTEETVDFLEKCEKIEKSVTNEGDSQYYLLVVPDKHSVYSQYLPQRYVKRANNTSNINKILDVSIGEGICGNNIIYPLPELSKYSEDYILYEKADSHWAEVGAFIASYSIDNKIHGENYTLRDSITDGSFQTYRTTSDHRAIANSMRLKEDFLTEKIITPKIKKPIKSIEKYSNGNVFYIYSHRDYKIEDLREGKTNTLLIFGDSFTDHGNFPAYFLDEFDAVLVIRSDFGLVVREDIIQEFEPDLVLQVFVERKLMDIDRDYSFVSID